MKFYAFGGEGAKEGRELETSCFVPCRSAYLNKWDLSFIMSTRSFGVLITINSGRQDEFHFYKIPLEGF